MEGKNEIEERSGLNDKEREEGEILEILEEIFKEVLVEVSEGDLEEEIGINEYLNMNIGKAGKIEKGERLFRLIILRLLKIYIKLLKKLVVLSAKEGFFSVVGKKCIYKKK